MGVEASLMVELYPVLHEPELLVIGGEHLVLQIMEEIGRKTLLQGKNPLGRPDAEVGPVRLALPDIMGHLGQALTELCRGPAPGGQRDRPVHGLAPARARRP